MRTAYVYIMSNKNRTTLYIGITNDIERRVAEHRAGIGGVFTKKYNLTDLMYYETYHSFMDAINREKTLKKWKRKWKNELIETTNKEWLDLAADWELPDVSSLYKENT